MKEQTYMKRREEAGGRWKPQRVAPTVPRPRAGLRGGAVPARLPRFPRAAEGEAGPCCGEAGKTSEAGGTGPTGQPGPGAEGPAPRSGWGRPALLTPLLFPHRWRHRKPNPTGSLRQSFAGLALSTRIYV